jgi:hypothetical protein
MQTLLLVNSSTLAYRDYREILQPFLEHIGLPYTCVDLNTEPLPAGLAAYALILAAHQQLDPGGTGLGKSGRQAILSAVRVGTGLVSFDPELPEGLEGRGTHGKRPPKGDEFQEIEFSTGAHPISALHTSGERIRLAGTLELPTLRTGRGKVLAASGPRPLVVAGQAGRGRIVRWASSRWLLTHILGPLSGLDDVLWRSLVWAARKPFFLRGLPPLVTMRVDDVAGQGELCQQSPLYWVHTSNRYGLKPWLGLFVGNLAPETVEELRPLLQSGRATAFPHAFGRRARPGYLKVYDENVFPLSNPERDEFIYFDHYEGCPWPAAEATRRLEAVDRWYAGRAPLPISPYAIPHWYEMGREAARHMQDRWGVDRVGKPQDVDLPLSDEVPWLKAAPYRLYEPPGTPFFDPARRGNRPVYYAGFVDLAGRKFFNCLTEIRDETGYEWAPDNDIEATVGRGVRQLRRALHSLALAVLFTHETDYLWKIAPAIWEEELKKITAEIASERPRYVTLDEGVRYVRATYTSRLASAQWESETGTVKAAFQGHADLPTHFFMFTEERDEIQSTLIEVPAFEIGLEVSQRL